jgi:GAF domain-containing protein
MPLAPLTGSFDPSAFEGNGVVPAIPLLRAEDASSDLDVLRTWQEAVSDALAITVPHDLFALWIYPPASDPVLIGPEALAEDHLIVPLPAPHIDPAKISVLEEIVRDAGYRSVKCVPIRHGASDVGLMLVAALAPSQYRQLQGATIAAASRAMGPLMGRIARRWPTAQPAETEESEAARKPGPAATSDASRLESLLTALGDALIGAGTPRDFTLALSFALQPLIPHDAIELLVPDAGGEQTYRLGAHGFGPLWSDPALVLPTPRLDLNRLFEDASVVRVRNTATDPRGPLSTILAPASADTGEDGRSLIGVKLRVLERLVGYLLVGSPGPDFYQPDDVMLLDRIGALITARVDSFVLLWHQQVLRANLSVLRHVPMHLSKIAEVLASTPLLGEGTRIFARQAELLLPLEQLEFAIRLGDETRVAIVRPGDTMPLADRPQTPIAGTPTGRVLRGELPYLLTEQVLGQHPVSVLVVPLRAAGLVIGAMAMTASGNEPLTRTDMAVAQQLADLIAPHFEIQRRTATAAPPFIPGWKRSPRY